MPSAINFTFAYTDPKADYDVSYHMDVSGGVEAGITAVRQDSGPRRDQAHRSALMQTAVSASFLQS